MIQEYDQLTSEDCSEPSRFDSSLSSTMGNDIKPSGKHNANQSISSIQDTLGSGSSISLDGASQQRSNTVREKSKSSTSLPSSSSFSSPSSEDKIKEFRERPLVVPIESHSADEIFQQCNNNEQPQGIKRSSTSNGSRSHHCNNRNNANHLNFSNHEQRKPKNNASKIGEGLKAVRQRRVKHFKPKGSKASPARKVIASYAVSVGHLLLYLPAMFVIGLKGKSLPPGVALLCGLVVYCEFIVQPVALLLISPRLRGEVKGTITNKKN